MTKLNNISTLVIDNFPSGITLPFMSESLSIVDNKEELTSVLSQAHNIWGNDCIGGIAYFGHNEDMKKIHQQTQHYLSNMSKHHAKNQFYLIWLIGQYSLLILYEDYQAEKNNPYPTEDNVFAILFGAWSDDENLLETLEEKTYIDDLIHWSYGRQIVDLNNIEQNNLLKNMKKTILSITCDN